jgi:hypothetical protein
MAFSGCRGGPRRRGQVAGDLGGFFRICLPYVSKHYGVYARTPGRAIISNSDGMRPSTRVYTVRCTWAPAAVSHLIW